MTRVAVAAIGVARAAENDKAARRRSARAALLVEQPCGVAQHSPFFACPGGQW